MMVNGKVLLAVSPQGVNSSNADGNGIGPTSFYEYDSTANIDTPAPSPSGGISGRAQQSKFLDLPDGTVLLSPGGSQLYVYTPDGSPLAAGQPNINKVQWNKDGSLHITGTLFNGISQGAAYGDDEQMDSNFPLVRFSNGSGVDYGTTYNWSSTSVQTGGRIVTTEVTVPPAVLDFPGQWSLQVVANGNASGAVSFYSPVWVDFVNYNVFFEFGSFIFPYSTLPQGVSSVASGGTIAIDASSQPSTGHVAPYTISNPMNADADWTWTRTVFGHCLTVACSRTWTGHGHGLAGRTRRDHCASIPRPLRGHRILRWRRSRACLGLNMMEIGLIRLLKNFVPPVFNLRGDGLNLADLPDGL